MSFHGAPPPHGFDSLVDLHGIVSRVEGLLYTLADAAVATDATAAAPDASTAVQKNGGWFGFISDAMEVVLKVLSIFHAFIRWEFRDFLHKLLSSGMLILLRESEGTLN